MRAPVEKGYIGDVGRQIHYRHIAGGDANPLVCLHPAPSSGLYFATAMPLLARSRDVYAPDYPGYGGSDPRGDSPSIGDYARAIVGFVDAVSPGSPVDLLGFHTGCLVAVEAAHLAPGRFGRLLLIDVPYFSAAEQAALRERMTQPLETGETLDCLAAAFKFNVTNRIGDVGARRSWELFAEHLRAGSGDARAFAAAFSYDAEARFAALGRNVTVIATRSGLLEPSRRAAAALPSARLVEALDIETAVFEASATTLARVVDDELNERPGAAE